MEEWIAEGETEKHCKADTDLGALRPESSEPKVTSGLFTYHMGCSWGLDRSEAINRDTLISVAIAEAAALDNEVIDRVVGKMLRLCVQVVSLTRAGLSLQQLHTEIGDLQLLLNFGTVRVFYVIW